MKKWELGFDDDKLGKVFKKLGSKIGNRWVIKVFMAKVHKRGVEKWELGSDDEKLGKVFKNLGSKIRNRWVIMVFMAKSP